MVHVPLLHTGVEETFLVPVFTTYSAASFALACFSLSLVSCVLELFRLALWWVEDQCVAGPAGTKDASCKCKQCASPILSLNAGDRKNYNTLHDDNSGSPSSLQHNPPVQSLLRRSLNVLCVGALTMLTYQGATLLMLVAMTMNIYLIVSIGAGAAVGKMISVIVKQRIMQSRK